MTTHREDLVSLEELQSMLAAHAGPDIPRTRPSGRRVRGWRPVLVAGVAVVALAGAGVAIAAGIGAFEGTPATPQVSTSFNQLNQMADQATQQGFSHAFPQADVSKAHGVIEVQTEDGPEDLWAAPSDQGGQCYFIDWANDPPEQDGSMYGFGGCPPPTTEPITIGDGWIAGHPNLITVSGSVSVDATTIQVALQDGSTMTLPVVEHAFLGSIAKPAQASDWKVVKATALDAAGNQVAEWTPPQ